MCIYGTIYQGIYACTSSYIFTFMIYNCDDARTDAWLDEWRYMSTHIYIYLYAYVYICVYIYIYDIESIWSLNKFQMKMNMNVAGRKTRSLCLFLSLSFSLCLLLSLSLSLSYSFPVSFSLSLFGPCFKNESFLIDFHPKLPKRNQFCDVLTGSS